ncbi:MAG: DUF1579 family protein [Bryobacterales bacterium]|jgi:hypothetical protein|nr:DUF1579 family protein [Bryobacterales bacterium]
MKTEPQAKHCWLRQLVGEWTYEVEAIPGLFMTMHSRRSA